MRKQYRSTEVQNYISYSYDSSYKRSAAHTPERYGSKDISCLIERLCSRRLNNYSLYYNVVIITTSDTRRSSPLVKDSGYINRLGRATKEG